MNEKVAKVAKKYTCNYCDYISCKENNYVKHLSTAKHKKRAILNNLNTFEQKSFESQIFECKKCNKKYKGRNGLWYHEKKCGIDVQKNTISPIDPSSNDVKLLTGLVVELVKSNSDLQKQVLEICQMYK